MYKMCVCACVCVSVRVYVEHPKALSCQRIYDSLIVRTILPWMSVYIYITYTRVSDYSLYVFIVYYTRERTHRQAAIAHARESPRLSPRNNETNL